MHYSIGYDKGYWCPCCNKFFNDVDFLIENSWKCPDCKKYIYIAAPDLGHGYTLTRIPIRELKQNDIVHLRGDEDIYPVIAIDYKSNGEVRVALKNYGSVTFKPTDFISVIMGGYYKDDWKDNSSDPCQ